MKARLARWLLRRALPADERDPIINELDEAAAARFQRASFRAWRWYWRESLGLVGLFVAERWRERRATRGVAPSASRPAASASRPVMRAVATPSPRNPDRAPPRVAPRKESIMRGMWRDAGYAIRQLVKQPGFTFVIVFTLALGIGPNTAIFSVVNGVLLRPLPYDEPGELALMRVDLSGLIAHPGIARAEVLDFRERAELLEDVGAVTRESTANLTAEGNMEAVLSAAVTPNLFSMLGVASELGRPFRDEEGRVDPQAMSMSPPVAILSHGLWQRRYGGDPTVVGRSIEVDGADVQIVGVMPAGFQLLLGPGTSLSPDVDLWRPLVLDPNDRGFWAYRTIVRLRDGVSFAQAQDEVSAIGTALVAEFPQAYEGSNIRFHLHPLHSDLVQNVRPAILALLGAVSLVLLIACTNAASLLLARTKAREREIAVRAALGAGRLRIMRQVLTESVVMGLAAGVVGLGLGAVGLEVLLSLQPGDLPRVGAIGLDRSVLGFTVTASFLAALLFGAIPAWQASTPRLHDTLKAGGRHGGGRVGRRTRSLLVVSEVAFSVMLLIGAGLLIRTFLSLSSVPLGFEPESVIAMQVPIDGRRYAGPERWSVYRQLLERVDALPGVRAAGAISILPLSNQNMMASFGPEGELLADSNWNGTSADYRFVTPGYFAAMGTRIVAGRDFEGAENEEIRPVAIVDAALARQVWPDEDPIGKRLSIGLGNQLFADDRDGVDVLGNNAPEIVGVVEHVRGIDVRREVRPQIYLPYRLGPRSNNVVVVRSSGDPAALVGLIRREAEALGTGRPINAVRAMSSYVADAMGATRFTLILLGVLAAIALLLSTVGIYSVIAFLVRDQTKDNGIRMALGAKPAEIVWMTVRKGMVMAALGVPIGLAGALLLTRFIRGLLYGVGSTDPATFVSIPLLLALVALAASYLPARRASRTDPLVALRDE